MDKKGLFEFIRDNLSLMIDDNYGADYGREYREIIFKLNLTNPETGEVETISTERYSF